MRIIYFFIIGVLLLTSCDDTIVQRSNDMDDLKRGMNFADTIYRCLQTKDVNTLVMKTDTMQISRQELKLLIEKFDKNFGKLLSFNHQTVKCDTELRNNKLWSYKFVLKTEASYEKDKFLHILIVEYVRGKLVMTGFRYELKIE